MHFLFDRQEIVVARGTHHMMFVMISQNRLIRPYPGRRAREVKDGIAYITVDTMTVGVTNYLC